MSRFGAKGTVTLAYVSQTRQSGGKAWWKRQSWTTTAVKVSLSLEQYLSSNDANARKKFTNIRSGAGLLRVETGRRENDRKCLVCALEDPGTLC